MSDYQASNPFEDDKHSVAKKLQKRQKHLQARLQDARQSQLHAQKRLVRARSRVQRKEQRVSRLEGRLARLHVAPETGTHLPSLHTTVSDDGNSTTGQSLSCNSQPSRFTDLSLQALAVVRDAYAVAVVAEQLAQASVTREIETEQHLDHIVTARHLLPEVMQVQLASDHSRTFALEAERSAQSALQLFSLLRADATTATQLTSDVVQPDQLSSLLRAVLPENSLFSVEDNILDVQEDEMLLEHVNAMLLASTATQAFSTSDDSLLTYNEHAQKARLLARQSDKMLLLVRSFVQEGLLVGVIAERALALAEDEVLHALALVEAVDAQVSQAQEISAADRLEE